MLTFICHGSVMTLVIPNLANMLSNRTGRTDLHQSRDRDISIHTQYLCLLVVGVVFLFLLRTVRGSAFARPPKL